MLSEEKKAINNLNFIVVTDIYDNEVRINKTEIVNEYNHSVRIVLNLITKLQKENEEKDKQIDLILNEQIQDGYLVNFNNLEEAREYYNKLAKEKEE